MLPLSSESLQKRGTCGLLRKQFLANPQAFRDFLEISGMNCSGTENEWWQGERGAWE